MQAVPCGLTPGGMVFGWQPGFAGASWRQCAQRQGTTAPQRSRWWWPDGKTHGHIAHRGHALSRRRPGSSQLGADSPGVPWSGRGDRHPPPRNQAHRYKESCACAEDHMRRNKPVTFAG